MKTKRSIWMLYAGSTAPKFVLLLLVMAVVETALFAMGVATAGDLGLAAVVRKSWIAPVFFAILVLWTLVASMPGLSKMQDTLDRLPLTKKEIVHRHVLYSTLSYVVLVGIQILLLVGLFLWYGRSAPEGAYGPQTILLTFYSSPFLHTLFPLADWPLILHNAMLAAALGMGTAAIPLNLRKNGLSAFWSLAVMLLILGWFFLIAPGGNSVAGMFTRGPIFLLIGAGDLIYNQNKSEEEQNED